MPLPKLSDKRSGAIAIQIYTAGIKRTLVAGPKGVHLRKSCLYFEEIVRSSLLLMVLTFYCQVLSEHC